MNADPHEVKNLADDPGMADVLNDMRSRMQEIVRGLPDLSFYPESYLVQNAIGNPVAFGQAHKAEIVRLADVADLALLPYEQAQPRIESALASEQPMIRYWGAMVASAFGSQAATLADRVRPLLQDESAIVRVRAAEFLGIIGAANPQPVLTEIVNSTRDPVLATEALNSVVYFRDFFQDRYPVQRADFHPVSSGGDIDDRLNYINGEPYPPRKPKAKRRKNP